MDPDHYPADMANAQATQAKAAYLASGQFARAQVGFGAATTGLPKDMPLTAQLSDQFTHHIQLAEVILKTLMEAHMRVFGPVPPSPADSANGALAPQPDTAEAHLIGAQRGLGDRLYALQHIANCIASRL